MTERVWKEYQKLDAKTRAGLKAKMETWVAERQLVDKHYKFERRESVGGKQVPIFAFKDWQTRLYGAPLPLEGRETFICSEIDIKKQDRANQEKLKRAAQNLVEFL